MSERVFTQQDSEIVAASVSTFAPLASSSLAENEFATQSEEFVREASPSLSSCVVSIVIPCLNEERFIGKVLENLARQYDAGKYEIIVVDGMSTDSTRAIVGEFARQHESIPVRLIDNPARNIPVALNTGISAARGEIIVRMDAHSVPSENYVRRCVELINEPNNSIVGMPWRISAGADTSEARAIALAVSHPFGIGDAKYRAPNFSGAQFVDTVPFGVFRKTLWQKLGGFNEALLANEDYDFNYRVREQGGRILLDASEHCAYFARATMSELGKQNFRYGSWKAQMVKLHPRSIKLRQLVAPAFVSSIILFGALGIWSPHARLVLLCIIAAYAFLSITCAVQLARRNEQGFDWKLVPLISLAFFVIHVFWGSGFLLGLMRTPR